LITGSSGLLGSTIARRLAMWGWTVLGVDRRPGPFTAVTADVTRPGLSSRLLRGVDAVTHTASLHVPDLKVGCERDELLEDVGREHVPSSWNADVRSCA
jgi:nucleoside-diphosphate-sugar epimerase